jgi:hypothetical protein
MTGTSQHPQALQVPRAPEGSTFAAATIAAEHFRGNSMATKPLSTGEIALGEDSWMLASGTALVLDTLLGSGTGHRRSS